VGCEHRVLKSTCPKCKSTAAWTWQRAPKKMMDRWVCDKCDVTNFLGKVPEWPNVPRTLYIGVEKDHQVKVYPLPPERATESWAQPYSIRSFVSQASSRLGGCQYWCQQQGSVMDEPVFLDMCGEPATGDMGSCHLVAGFILGHSTCALWEKISKLCHTEMEQRFLRWYVGLVKDRQFPMLIPQVRVGIAERRRPDFVAFVPFQYWKYKLYAIELDGAHPDSNTEDDKLRDAELAVHGYEVISLRPEQGGYMAEVKRLVEQIERDMMKAEANPWEVALEIPVTRSVPVPAPF
jgi:hypothetical protein